MNFSRQSRLTGIIRRGWTTEEEYRARDDVQGPLTDDDQLVYVNNVIKGKLLESEELVLQASNNTKAQFANSPTLSKEIMNAVMDALAWISTEAESPNTYVAKRFTRLTNSSPAI